MIVIDMWHIIEDRWVHLFQECYEDKTVMYVNGKLSGVANVSPLRKDNR
jgi:hypothetical protein